MGSPLVSKTINATRNRQAPRLPSPPALDGHSKKRLPQRDRLGSAGQLSHRLSYKVRIAPPFRRNASEYGLQVPRQVNDDNLRPIHTTTQSDWGGVWDSAGDSGIARGEDIEVVFEAGHGEDTFYGR